MERILAAPRTATSMSNSLAQAIAQAECQVVVHAHVLIDRIILEHHGDVAILGLPGRSRRGYQWRWCRR